MSSDESSDEESSSASSAVVAYEEDHTNYESSGTNNDDNDNNNNNINGANGEDTEEEENGNELAQLQKECRAMVTLLKRLRREEEDLREKNVMLAREAILCGFQMEALEALPPKRRMTKPTASRKDEGKVAP